MSNTDTMEELDELRALSARARLFIVGVSTRVSIDGVVEASVQVMDSADLSILEIPTDVATTQALGNFFAQACENENGEQDTATNRDERKTITRETSRSNSPAPVFRQA
jgi:hypothetical protein